MSRKNAPTTQAYIEQLKERIQVFEDKDVIAFPGVETAWRTGKDLADETRRMEVTQKLIELIEKQSS